MGCTHLFAEDTGLLMKERHLIWKYKVENIYVCMMGVIMLCIMNELQQKMSCTALPYIYLHKVLMSDL